MKFLLILLLSLGSLQAMSKASPPQAALIENLGVRTLQYEDVKRKRPVIVELWYPTQKEGPVEQVADLWIHPKEVRDVELANKDKKYPLIIMSPGHKGDRRYLSWLADALVKNGFLVACVEHHGNSWRSYSPLISLRFWERAKDISFAITELFNEPLLKDRIDPNRVGFVGYSLGGVTGLLLGGAQAQNVKEVLIRLHQHDKEVDIALVHQLDFSEAHNSFFDPRVKAMALLSPANFVFPPQSLKQVKLPLALVASESDELLPYKDHAHPIIEHVIPTKLKIFRDKVSHYVFLNRVSQMGKHVVRKDLQTDAIEKDRPGIQKEIGQFVADFFQEHL